MYLSKKRILYTITHLKENLKVTGKLFTYNDINIVSISCNVYFKDSNKWCGYFYINSKGVKINGNEQDINSLINEIISELNGLGYEFRTD